MARLPRDSRIETRDARRKLKADKRAYWRHVNVGIFVGYAKGAKRATWIARWRDGDGYREQRLGAADDVMDADGATTLSYAQAVKAAQECAKGQARAAPRFYGDGLTVNVALDNYLTWRKADRPDSSANTTDAHAFGRHVRPKFGSRLLSSLTSTELSDWLLGVARSAPTHRASNGARKIRKDVDLRDPDVRRQRRQSANRIWNAFRAALNHAWRDERNGIESDAAWRRVKPLDVPQGGPPRMLDALETTRLINSAAGDFRALLRGALFTGARYGELTNLRVADFLADEKFIVIRQGKTGKSLMQPLTDEGAAFFEQLCAGRRPDALMFTRAGDAAWQKSDQARPMREAAERAKLDDVSFKVTRATYGKNLLLATSDIELVAKALGHSDSRVTRKHYAQYLPNELAVGVRKMQPLGMEPTKVSKFKPRRGASSAKRSTGT